MKKILGVLILLFLGIKANALDVVYPKKTPVTINSASTFFIGSANPSDKLLINALEVPISKIGAFAQAVILEIGENNFTLKSGEDELNFKIIRPEIKKSTYTPPSLIEYPPMDSFFVSRDNAPLRTTPINSGINRLTHLPEGMRLTINGEKGDFYRVYLNSSTIGWIDKSNVIQKEVEENISPLELKNFKLKETDEYCIYEANFEGSTPFVIKEDDNGLTLQLFNIKDEPDNTFCREIPVKKLFGYDAYFNNHKFILKVRKFPDRKNEELKNLKIIIDAGHGGAELGAIGCCGDKEKDINLAISKELEKELNSRGATIVMTRTDDTYVSLQDRVDLAKEKDGAILISLHANALPDGKDPMKIRGTSVYYYHNQAKALAHNVLCQMIKQLKTENDKVRQGSLALVRPTASVSILIEVAYMINPDDYALLLDKDFQQKCAKSIADGIERYLKE